MIDDGPISAFRAQIGYIYRVEMDDCCVAGEFTAKVIDKSEDEVWFDNGVYLHTLPGVSLYEVPE